jgi:hypothetical protein
MNQVTISESEYLTLKKHSESYKKLVSEFYGTIINDPIQNVVNDFKNTDLYTDGFIKDLENGLKKSSYFSEKY